MVVALLLDLVLDAVLKLVVAIDLNLNHVGLGVLSRVGLGVLDLVGLGVLNLVVTSRPFRHIPFATSRGQLKLWALADLTFFAAALGVVSSSRSIHRVSWRHGIS